MSENNKNTKQRQFSKPEPVSRTTDSQMLEAINSSNTDSDLDLLFGDYILPGSGAFDHLLPNDLHTNEIYQMQNQASGFKQPAENKKLKIKTILAQSKLNFHSDGNKNK